jgi:uncharacterized protein YkwD
MLSLLKAFAALVVATLGTTALVTHLPHSARTAHASQPPSQPLRFESSGDIQAEWAQLHPPKPAYVPPTPEPEPAQPEQPAWAAPAAPRLPAQPPAVVIGSAQQALINQDRAAAGLPPLTWSSCLAGIAAGQASAMASQGRIFHGSGVNQDLGCGLGSTHSGENVGYWSAGINDPQLNTMFMNSPEHRANIMGSFRYVGTAWAVAPNGYAYIAVEFA